MQVILESTNLKRKGFISFFKAKKFEISFHENLNCDSFIIPLVLKAKVAFAGFTTALPDIERFFVKVRVDENVTEHEILIKEGKVDIKINNTKIKGVITLNIIDMPVFTTLENTYLIKKGLNPIVGNISTCSKKANENIVPRQSYNNKCYYVDLVTLHSTWQKDIVGIEETIPKGWERKYTTNNRIYYVNHNKNTTQWDNPNAKSYITELENKILKYRLFSEESNLFQFFDFSKFRIIVSRKYMVQSTASHFLRARREHLLRQPFVIFYGEIGEDYGGLVKEFFYDASLEIAKDERIKCLGNVFDIRSTEELMSTRIDALSVAENDVEEKVVDSEQFTGADNHLEARVNAETEIDQMQENNDLIVNDMANTRDTNNENMADMPRQINDQPIVFDTNQIEGTVFTLVDRNGVVTERVELNNNHTEDVLANPYNPNDPWFCEDNYSKNKLSNKDFFVYLGIFLGLALEHEFNIATDFSLAFYENLLGRKFELSHVQDVKLQTNLLYVLNNNVEGLEMFNMKDEPLTEENKFDYIQNAITYYLYENKKQEYDWIREGFYRVAINQVTDIFTANDLSRMFTGKEDLTLEVLQNSVLYFNCNSTSTEIIQFWNILSRKDELFYQKFLHFITGSASIPITGLKTNKYKWFIELLDEHDVLVRASSCLNKLFIGKYQSESIFEEKLVFSIENTEGFHKV